MRRLKDAQRWGQLARQDLNLHRATLLVAVPPLNYTPRHQEPRRAPATAAVRANPFQLRAGEAIPLAQEGRPFQRRTPELGLRATGIPLYQCGAKWQSG